MKNGIRFFLLAGVIGLTLVSTAAGTSEPTQIVVQGGAGFLVETLDGTVTGSVGTAPGTNPGDYSAAANGSIAYVDDNAGAGDHGPVWLVNGNQSPVELDSSPYDLNVAISPDGSKVAFTREDPTTGSSDIYVVNADGSGLTLIASGGGSNNLSSPAFSPDGSAIAYECRALSGPLVFGIGCGPTAIGTYADSGLMLMNADGSNKRMILSYYAGTVGDSLSWSPDGQSIALSGFSGNQGTGPDEVFVYRTDGSDLLKADDPSRQVTHDADGDLFPRFSPDGTQIIFEKVINNQYVFFTVASDGTNEQELSSSLPTLGGYDVVPPATGGGPPPTVSVTQLLPAPDGPVVVASYLASCSGYLVETAADSFTACVPGHGRTGFFSNTSISVASDDSIVYSDLSAGPAGADGPIWLSRPNAAPVELDSNVYDFEPSISADGSLVTFAREAPASGNVSGGSDIYTIRSDGSDLKLVASGTGASGMYLSNPTLSPDGSAIAYVCSSIDHSYAENNKFCGPLFDGTFRVGGLMRMNADGSDKRMIVTRGIGSDLSWSPDGQWLATAGSAPGGNGQVFAYRADGSDLYMGATTSRQITHETQAGGAWDPQFSPDGSQVMYQMNSDDKRKFRRRLVLLRDRSRRDEPT